MPTLPGYTQFGGRHPETAALTNVLAAQGAKAPHTGRPYTEAMLLGVGGGLGAGYILWEFKAHPVTVSVLVLGFRINWQYPLKFMETAAQRLNAAVTVRETGGRAAAATHLTAALDSGTPAIAWVDLGHLPYLQLPDSLKGHIGHLLVVCGRDDDGAFWLDDRAAQPYRVTADELANARARITSYKNKLGLLGPGRADPNLATAVEAGLRDCVANLGAKSDSFSLPTLRKWSRLMTDTKNAKGWPVVFKTRRGLYNALQSTFEGIELAGNAGGGLRGLYADFLDEAAEVVRRPALQSVAATYRALAGQWTQLAEAALPDAVAPFQETKRLLRQKHAALMQGQAGVAMAQPITDQLADLGRRTSREFPLEATEVDTLFSDLGERLSALYAAEIEALAELKAAV
jgi:hypothetical protein